MKLDSALLTRLSEELPFLDLFEQLRSAGMQLTMEHYDLLQRSLWRGHGSGSWADLQRVCGILWVKPSASYDRALFDREFERYRQKCLEEAPKDNSSKDTVVPKEEIKRKPIYPEVPPRLMPERSKPSQYKAPIGVRTPFQDGQLSGKDWKLTPMDLPISVPKVQESWRALRQVSRTGLADEVDFERTLAQISRLGFLEDVVLKSSLRQRSELVVLVDEGDGMLPYFPALKPLFQAIEGGWVTPARMYRFTGYPLKFLYDWEKPTQSEVVDVVLSRLHRTRTMVVVVSDAGAAIGVQNTDRVQGTAKFLERWEACVCQILWVNPVPERRWEGTPAAAIKELLGGRMLALDALGGTTVRLLMQSIGVQSGRWGQS